MGILGTGDSKRATRAAEQAAREAQADRDELKKREERERLKVQKKFIRGVRGQTNPFGLFGDTLGGSTDARVGGE